MYLAANENRTTLYRIRRKEDGRFLVSAPLPTPGGCPFWGTCGCYWKRPETIIKHLMELCAFRVYCSDGGSVSHRKPQGMEYRKLMGENPFSYGYRCDTPHELVGYYYHWLDKYEVVATEISVHGQHEFGASEFKSIMEDAKERIVNEQAKEHI